MSAADVLTVSVRIDAPPEAVFPYLVEPDLLIRWLGEWADLDGKPGGTFAVDINKTPVRGEYVEVDPPRRVVFTWGVAGKDSMPPGSTTVEVVLTPDEGATVVELFHRDLPAEDRLGHLAGWTEKLGQLVALHG